jgi:hypothetical protein
MKVHFAEFRNQQEQAVGFIEFGDVLLKTKVLDDFTGIFGEALDKSG